MKPILKCKLADGNTVEVCVHSFAKYDFTGATVLGGDKYYVEKAISRGAKKLPRKAEK